ncbi:MAG TPA: hypothetical protein VGO34_12795 [Alphaproteobacteria bacterium]|jgi:hypothetical protein
MKTGLVILAAGVALHVQAAQAQNFQSKPPEINSGQMYQGPGGAPMMNPSPGQPTMPTNVPPRPQQGLIASPQLPANLLDPAMASKATTDIYSVMVLMQQMAQQMRDQARTDRSATMDAQVQAIQDAAAKIQQAAAATMQQAQINGAMQIAAAAMQIGTTGPGMSQLKPGSQVLGKPQGTMAGAPTAKPLTPQEKQQALGAIGNAQQAFAANMAAAEADRTKAQAVAMAAQAQAQTAQQAQAQQMVQQMQDVIRDVQAKLQAIQQSQGEATRQLSRY